MSSDNDWFGFVNICTQEAVGRLYEAFLEL